MNTTPKRATFLASLGAGLEYYDFVIYGMMAGTLSTLFFAADVPWIANMKAFGVFAVGYIARPIGGILFASQGDKRGRKNVFILVMLLMAAATFAIGLLPTYAQAGSLASILLIALRILQGLSFGAELPGAITVVCEYATKKSHGSYSGYLLSSVSIGAILASFILYLVTATITNEHLLSWGWRIPFLLGGSLALVNVYIRKQLSETPEYVKIKSEAIKIAPFSELLRRHLGKVLIGVGMTLLLSSLVIFVLYLPTYLNLYYGYQSSDVYLSMTYGLVWSALSMPIAGKIADRTGKIPLYISTALAFVVGVFPLFAMLKQGGFVTLVIFMCIYQTIISLLTVSYFPILVRLFPTEVRFTGIATAYNLTYSVMGTLPLIATSLILFTGSAQSAVFFLVVCAISSITACACMLPSSGFQDVDAGHS